ncbi:probable actin-histidine N-methyltransferase [Coccomyxa sp. Obi]|nr:probable actin-histidine N-methyltransferase [Coccomyxa sp. Obi]
MQPKASLRLFASASSAARLVDWVSSSGGTVSPAVNVSLPDSIMGAGLKASKACRTGELLVSLPRSCQLSYDGSTEPNLLQLISKVPEELWGAKLALRVLKERILGPDSSFQYYIDNLPMGVPGIPMFFSPDAIRALEQYPPLSEQVKKRCRWLLSFSSEHLSALPGSPADPFKGTPVDANILGWALAMTTSRAFRVRGPQHPAALLPLIDMSNHSFSPNCEVKPGPAGSVEMVAARDISQDEDLLLSYGALDNTFLLLDYGFIVPGNQYDTVLIRYDPIMFEAGQLLAQGQGAPPDEAPDLGSAAYQQQLLTEMQLLGPKADLELAFGRSLQRCSPRLLAVARLFTTASAAEVRGRTADDLGAWDQPLSLINEVKALRMVAGVAAMLLTRFPTTLEQDRRALEGPGDLAPDVRAAVQFRAEKKVVLSEVLQDIAHRIRGLASQKLPQGAAEAYRESMAQGCGGQKRNHSTSSQKAKMRRGRGFG